MGDGASGGADGKSGGGSNFDCYIGSLISLTSKSDIRYEGVLYTIDAEKCTIALANVRSHGTEGRKKEGPHIPPTDKVYDYIIFRGSDIKDLQVKSSPQPPSLQPMQSQPYSDPAIIAQSQHQSEPSPVANGPIPPMGSWGPRPPPPVANGPIPPMGSWGPRPPPPVANGPMPMYWPGYYPPSGPQYLHSPGVPPPEPLLHPPPELLQKPDLNKNIQQHPHPGPAFLQHGLPLQQGISSSSGIIPLQHDILPSSGSATAIAPMAKLARLPSVSQVQVPTLDIPELVKKPVPSVSTPQSSPSQHPTPPPARDFQARDQPPVRDRDYQAPARDHPAKDRDYQRRDYQGRDYQRDHQANEYRHWRGGNGRGRGRGRGAVRATNFTEDFDFTAMNEKFNKDEVWGELGKSDARTSDDDDTTWQEDITNSNSKKPVYCKDDFFDSLSCDALDRAAHADRPRFSEQRKINTETFGDTFLRSRGRGYRGGYRGQNYRGRGRNQPQATASS